jgi:hypothetical protein
MFVAICFGLGYPTLRRYDPRYTEGMSDTWKYYAITTGADTSGFKEMFRCRVLVPLVARPFYLFAQKFLPNWNAGFFGLLFANALFCATTACLIVVIGNLLFGNLPTSLLAAALYLLSFNIANLQLAGLIDSGEACFMAALVFSLLTRRWYLLPVWAVLGALAKETFVPFAVLLSFTWWLVERRERGAGSFELLWVIVLAVIGLTTVSTVHSLVAGELRLPWQIAGQAQAPENFFVALWHCVSERSFWYVFGWLLPLGICRLKYFPKPWLIASLVTAIFAILLGAYSNAGGTVSRGTFDIIGPLLSLSVALLISKLAFDEPAGASSPAPS